MKKLLALLVVVTLTTNVVVAGVAIANADKKKQNDIRILQSKLEAILKSKTDAKWDVSELQKKVDTEFGEGEITVSFKDYTKVTSIAKAEFIFKANNKKYTGQLTLTQTYEVKDNKAEDISVISTRLTSILSEKPHDEWTVTDLQTKIDSEFGNGEIAVSGGTYSDDNNYTGETKKKAEFTFTGNATTDPENTLKYIGEITLTHTYTKQTVISNAQINTVVTDLANHDKFDNKEAAKSAIEAAFAYKEAASDAEPTGIKGIEKAEAKYNKSVEDDKSSFTVTLTLSTGYVLEQTTNTVEVTVNLMSRTDISTNEEFKQELTSFVNDEAHKNQAWTKDGLQSALNTKYGSEEFDVTEDDSTVTYDNSELGKKTEKFVITGQGSKENNKQYQGELKVTHDYKVTANISTIKNELETILKDKDYEEKTWTLDELQKAVDTEFNKGQITVEEVILLKDDNSNVVKNTKEWKFIGNSNDENEFVYTGDVTLPHTWKSYKVLASDIQTAAEVAINGKSYANIEAAQEDITNAVQAITGVDSVIYPTETPKDWNDETIKFTVTFKENYVIEGKNDFSVKARVGNSSQNLADIIKADDLKISAAKGNDASAVKTQIETVLTAAGLVNGTDYVDFTVARTDDEATTSVEITGKGSDKVVDGSKVTFVVTWSTDFSKDLADIIKADDLKISAAKGNDVSTVKTQIETVLTAAGLVNGTDYVDFTVARTDDEATTSVEITGKGSDKVVDGSKVTFVVTWSTDFSKDLADIIKADDLKISAAKGNDVSTVKTQIETVLTAAGLVNGTDYVDFTVARTDDEATTSVEITGKGSDKVVDGSKVTFVVTWSTDFSKDLADIIKADDLKISAAKGNDVSTVKIQIETVLTAAGLVNGTDYVDFTVARTDDEATTSVEITGKGSDKVVDGSKVTFVVTWSIDFSKDLADIIKADDLKISAAKGNDVSAVKIQIETVLTAAGLVNGTDYVDFTVARTDDEATTSVEITGKGSDKVVDGSKVTFVVTWSTDFSKDLADIIKADDLKISAAKGNDVSAVKTQIETVLTAAGLVNGTDYVDFTVARTDDEATTSVEITGKGSDKVVDGSKVTFVVTWSTDFSKDLADIIKADDLKISAAKGNDVSTVKTQIETVLTAAGLVNGTDYVDFTVARTDDEATTSVEITGKGSDKVVDGSKVTFVVTWSTDFSKDLADIIKADDLKISAAKGNDDSAVKTQIETVLTAAGLVNGTDYVDFTVARTDDEATTSVEITGKGSDKVVDGSKVTFVVTWSTDFSKYLADIIKADDLKISAAKGNDASAVKIQIETVLTAAGLVNGTDYVDFTVARTDDEATTSVEITGKGSDKVVDGSKVTFVVTWSTDFSKDLADIIKADDLKISAAKGNDVSTVKTQIETVLTAAGLVNGTDYVDFTVARTDDEATTSVEITGKGSDKVVDGSKVTFVVTWSTDSGNGEEPESEALSIFSYSIISDKYSN
ncbi:hypothetical protein [Mesoplasma florum]|nr:hypothetical protein [Mesoplasma florum]